MTITVKDSNIREALLQEWVKAHALKGTLHSQISNRHAVKKYIADTANYPHYPDDPRRKAYIAADKICDALADAKCRAADQVISASGKTRMRPDLLLAVPDQGYLVVELKTKAKATRETVQELLAYAQTVRSQMLGRPPIRLVIVSMIWPEALRLAIKDLFTLGYGVLPISCQPHRERGFELFINTHVFNFDPEPWYDPLYAFSLHTITTTSRHVKARQALASLTSKITDYCKRDLYTGFAMFWELAGRAALYGVTLATLNENWRHSPETPVDLLLLDTPQGPIHRLTAQQADATLHEKGGIDNPEAVAAALEYYPQSQASAQILSDFRDSERLVDSYQWEEKTECLFNFLSEWWHLPTDPRIHKFQAFGELHHFLYYSAPESRDNGINSAYALQIQMNYFCEFKAFHHIFN